MYTLQSMEIYRLVYKREDYEYITTITFACNIQNMVSKTQY